MKVAWIGMGRIGKQMALRVLEAGYDLVGHARTPEKQEEVRLAGARLTTSLNEAVSNAELICVNVYSEAQLHEALIESGSLAEIDPGAVLAIHSTVGPAAIAELTNARPDVRVLDAAFSGTDVDAAKGTIALMVGGDAAALADVRPVFQCYADYVSHVGPTGAGMTLKLVNNAIFGAQMLLARDALKIVRASGIDEEVAVETLARSSGGSFAIKLFGSDMDPEQRMAAIWPYLEKDVAVARAAAEEMGIDLGMLDVATRPFLET
jgi:3-hydroxyisobutyrate dehydrogenase